jgi:hypothetical protein
VSDETELKLCNALAANDPWPCILEPGHPARHCDTNGNTWRHDHKYGTPDHYEITWMTGHIETVLAHQITWPNSSADLRRMFGGLATATEEPRFVRMHAELDGRWCLTLQAREEDIRSIRLVTNAERIPGAES